MCVCVFVGVSMNKVDSDGGRSFVIVHNSMYQNVQRMFWHAVDSLNHDLIAVRPIFLSLAAIVDGGGRFDLILNLRTSSAISPTTWTAFS